MSNKVLVLGATGKIGGVLVKQLQERKVQIRVLARDVNKAKQQLGEGVEIVHGDSDDIKTVSPALHGIDRLFLLTNNQRVEGDLARAAKFAGVKHIVKISVINASIGEPFGSIMHNHGQAEIDVAAAGVPFTYLRPFDFMQNNFGSAATIKGMGKFFGCSANGYWAPIDARDIAACAAQILVDPIEKHAGQSYDLTGPQALTHAEQAAIATKALGKPVEYVDLPDHAFHGALVKAGMPASFARMLVVLQQCVRRLGGHPYATTDVEFITGKPARTLHAFFEENKAAFV